jgi:hypothetical protein
MGSTPCLKEMHPWPLSFPARRGQKLLSLGVDMVLLGASGALLGLAEALWFARLHAGTPVLVLLLRHGEALLGGTILWALTQGLFAWAYFVLLRAASGRTCGEALWGLRLMGRDGTIPGIWDCIQRGVAAVISLLPLGAGYWWSFLNRQGRSWQDHLSGTLIVEECPHLEPRHKDGTQP